MPPVDLDNLVSACAGGCTDNKITCETLADSSADDETPEDDDAAAPVNADPDFPPESFWLSKDAEYDWFDRNAFYDRKGSGKGNANSSNLNTGTSSTSNSQRFSGNLKSKAAMIGLPKTQKTTYVDSKRRVCKTVNMRLFPKRAESAGKSTSAVAEPGSPKVSCMGRVRSKRGRRRSNSSRRREKPMEKPRSGEKQKTGIYSKVMSMFRSKKGRKKPPRSGSRRAVEVADEEAAAVVELQRKSVRGISAGSGMAAEAPGLGGVKRFVSGRRSSSWAAEDFSQTDSGSLETNRHVGVGVVSWS